MFCLLMLDFELNRSVFMPIFLCTIVGKWEFVTVSFEGQAIELNDFKKVKKDDLINPG